MQKELERNNETIETAIKNLADALKDQERLKALWPDAPTHMDLFDHLKLTFDLEQGKIQTETSAKDVRGKPYYQHIFDVNDKSKVAVESLIKPAEKVPMPHVPA